MQKACPYPSKTRTAASLSHPIRGLIIIYLTSLFFYPLYKKVENSSINEAPANHGRQGSNKLRVNQGKV